MESFGSQSAPAGLFEMEKSPNFTVLEPALSTRTLVLALCSFDPTVDSDLAKYLRCVTRRERTQVALESLHIPAMTTDKALERYDFWFVLKLGFCSDNNTVIPTLRSKVSIPVF